MEPMTVVHCQITQGRSDLEQGGSPGLRKQTQPLGHLGHHSVTLLKVTPTTRRSQHARLGIELSEPRAV